ncbi:MAG: succinoglycan biosynthesis protein exoa [Ignavibacteria bacterium CG22_combo_CG10-13_8_21_14_all_37_15]|nr:MAG: succinoglycan biosynthesis protein exoa [Ignavibacteria bacterium CG22_combo_CG10-13_8_21_14_all_37_15]
MSANLEKLILISVVIPCRNEQKYIVECLQSLLNQELSRDEYEIIVVDGLSDDGTREILVQFEKQYPMIHVIDNERKITPVAMNLGIRNARGENIAICGSHTKYDTKFLSSALKLLQDHSEAGCVGGPIISVGENDFAKAASIAMSSPIGVGNAKHRFPDYEGFAEMACFPIYRKKIFKEIGYFDENLVRNQDDEFSLRYCLVGGKVFISPKVKSIYYVRNSSIKLFKQYFQYGFWRWVVLKKHKIQISYRQMIPSIFILFLLLLFIVGIVIKSYTTIFVLPLIYFLILSGFSIRVIKKESLKIGSFFIEAVIILHFSYGLGVIYSFLKDKLNK